MQLEAMILFVMAMTATPGPNNLMIMTSVVNFGLRRSLPHYLGICLGFPVLIVCVGLGLDKALEGLPWLFPIIRILGVAYLAYMAFGLFQQAWRPTQGVQLSSDKNARFKGWGERPLRFYEAVLFQWVNPKAWVIALAGLAAFANLAQDGVAGVLRLALVDVLVGTPCVALWLFGGYGIRRWLNSPGRLRAFNGGMGLLLVLSLYPIVMTQAP